MSDKPRSAVAGNIKFRDYAYAAIPRISNHVADFFLRVIPPVGAQLLQLGKSLAFDAEALIVREVPVKNIHLHGIHAIQVATDHVQRSEVSRGIDHQPAPRDRKSTRLNSSHVEISYAVFCLKKKKRIKDKSGAREGT